MNLGNKFKNLKWLKENKFSVPAFVALSEDEFKNDILVLQKTERLEFPLAVRSSFAGEDGLNHSFAGLFDSILNVQNKSELLKAVKDVAISLESDRVLEYCQYRQVPAPTWGSIVVQEMIDSKISGVLFTEDPMNSANMLISSTLGLGDRLVSGLADSEDLSLPLVRPQFQDRSVLNAFLQKRLFDFGKKIQSLKKSPQDIEWAIDQNDQIHFLQTRDITIQIQNQIQNPENPVYFDNSNIQESFIGVTSPLTFSYAKNAYRHSYNTLMKVMGFSHEDIAQNDWRHQHMLGLVDGRVYYNINSWYEGLLFLPHFGRHKTDMENMMGLETSIDFIQTQKLSTSQKIKALPKMIRLLTRMIYKFSVIKSEVAKFDHAFSEILKDHRNQNHKKKSLPQLLTYLIDVQNKGLALWGPPLMNDFYVMIYSGKVRRALSKLGLEKEYPHLMKTDELESFKPVLAINQMTELIKSKDQILSALNTVPDFLIYCKKNDTQVYQAIQHFIENYGDRVLGELKLETETFRTNPQLLVETLKLFVNSQSQRKTQEPAVDQIFSQMNFIQRLVFNSDLKKLQNGIRYRELMRFHRTRSFGIVREIYLLIADQFVNLNLIKEKMDLFYLTENEIADIITFQSVQNDIHGLIALRKAEYQQFSNAPKYKNQIRMNLPLSNDDKFFTENDRKPTTNDKLQGTGCYPGVVKAQICFVKNVSDAKELEGKILLAERTDPGWTPLFYLAKAVIVEKGSILSHAAIVAREVGIPIIIGVPQATQTLKSGDWVTMNGTTGEIQINGTKS